MQTPKTIETNETSLERPLLMPLQACTSHALISGEWILKENPEETCLTIAVEGSMLARAYPPATRAGSLDGQVRLWDIQTAS